MKALKRAAHNGDCHLMLGGQLSEMIADHFGVEIEADGLLWRIYDRAARKTGSEQVYS
jgi:hypothetical protein